MGDGVDIQIPVGFPKLGRRRGRDSTRALSKHGRWGLQPGADFTHLLPARLGTRKLSHHFLPPTEKIKKNLRNNPEKRKRVFGNGEGGKGRRRYARVRLCVCTYVIISTAATNARPAPNPAVWQVAVECV